eukprot:TRINITY_DN62403_c0_g1_i1.p1 TRINITY_DN62403_c0_g1~~TRINITY_DN62403_c0_g1_i1.p1  ORF type:complete len:520 (+),score=108.73 TRINITY_DN62403_c0_g1_i1:36-1595(+)
MALAAMPGLPPGITIPSEATDVAVNQTSDGTRTVTKVTFTINAANGAKQTVTKTFTTVSAPPVSERLVLKTSEPIHGFEWEKEAFAKAVADTPSSVFGLGKPRADSEITRLTADSSPRLPDTALTPAQRLVATFRRFDADGDGIITRDELKRIFEKLSKKHMSDAEVQELLEEIDTNGDGLIDYGEFAAWLKMGEASQDVAGAVISTYGRGSGVRLQTTSSGAPVPAWRWGITKEQLRETFRRFKASPQWHEDHTIADSVELFVKPMTADTGVGLSLLLNRDDPQRVSCMISHAWCENASRFFDDLECQLHDHEVSFICAFALHQGSFEDISAQLGPSLTDGPFASVIANIADAGGRMLVVPNEELKENGQGLYSRMWCDWEIFFAKCVDIPVEFTHRKSKEHLFGRNNNGSCEARCGNPALPMNEDERRIREAILSKEVKIQVQLDDGSIGHRSMAETSCFLREDGTEMDPYERVDYFISGASGHTKIRQKAKEEKTSFTGPGGVKTTTVVKRSSHSS